MNGRRFYAFPFYRYVFNCWWPMTDGMTILVENMSIDRNDHLVCPNIALLSTLDIIDIKRINKTREWIDIRLWTDEIHSIHYNDDIMSSMASQITSLTIVYSTVYSDTDQRKRQSSASLAFVWGIHWWPVSESPAQRASAAENVFIWWRHHAIYCQSGLSAGRVLYFLMKPP